jgi:hypothetical protein
VGVWLLDAMIGKVTQPWGGGSHDANLVSDEASFFTGQDIAVDGGDCAGMRFETNT